MKLNNYRVFGVCYKTEREREREREREGDGEREKDCLFEDCN